MKNIALRFKKVRETKVMTQVEFAELLDTSQRNISCYENGKLEIPDKIKTELFKLGINMNWLLTGEGGMFLSDTGSLASGTADDPVRKKLIEMMDDLNEDELSDLRKYLREKAEMRNMKTELEYLKRKVG